MASQRMRMLMLAASAPLVAHAADAIKCPGGINVVGHGPSQIVAATWNTPGIKTQQVDVVGDTITAHMGGRAYFADSCAQGPYNPTSYQAMSLLGKTLKYTTDVSGAGCGCNSAFYLVSMHQNTEETACKDYYCDANKVCGTRCSEIDIQEANEVAWYSSLHVEEDGAGVGGGDGATRHDWTKAEYGPGARCIDTTQPFQVSVSFPTTYEGTLAGMEVILTQGGKCPLKTLVHNYHFGGRNGLPELGEALAAGMTPVVSYWASSHLDWMDGIGDGKGPCAREEPKKCADTTQFYGFIVEDYTGTYHGGDASSTDLGGDVPGASFPGAGAAVPMPTPVPVVMPPWTAAQDPYSGRTYYYNTITRQTSWSPPSIYT